MKTLAHALCIISVALRVVLCCTHSYFPCCTFVLTSHQHLFWPASFIATPTHITGTATTTTAATITTTTGAMNIRGMSSKEACVCVALFYSLSMLSLPVSIWYLRFRRPCRELVIWSVIIGTHKVRMCSLYEKCHHLCIFCILSFKRYIKICTRNCWGVLMSEERFSRYLHHGTKSNWDFDWSWIPSILRYKFKFRFLFNLNLQLTKISPSFRISSSTRLPSAFRVSTSTGTLSKSYEMNFMMLFTWKLGKCHDVFVLNNKLFYLFWKPTARSWWQRPILVSCWSRVPFPAWVLWVMCSPQALTVTRQSRPVRRRGCRLSILGVWLYWIVREVRLARPRERGASHKTHCAKRTMKIRYGGCIWFSTRSGTMSWFLPKAPFVR